MFDVEFTKGQGEKIDADDVIINSDGIRFFKEVTTTRLIESGSKKIVTTQMQAYFPPGQVKSIKKANKND